MSFHPRKRIILLLCAGATTASLLLAAGASSEPAPIREKRAEAEAVLAQMRQIDSELGQAVESYNQATLRLDAIEAELAATREHLGIARKANKAALRNLERRLVALYLNGDQSLLEVIFGSASLDDMLERIDASQRVTKQDGRIVQDVERSRAEYRAAAKKLERARTEQKAVVAAREATREQIEAKLAERQRLYDSVQSEIQQLEAEERRRQARLAAEADRRLAAQEEASQAGTSSSVSGGGDIAAAPPNPYGGVVGVALGYLGVPYVWGGASPSGFDCSGLVVFAFAQIGVSLPHSSYALWGMGVPVSSGALEPGDLVFFDGLGHMGIYIGGGQFVHAPHTGDVVKISSLGDSWYAGTYVGARRIL